MASTRRRLTARVAYAGVFLVLLPAALVAWAAATSDVVRLPAHRLPGLGLVLIVTGVALMAAGAAALHRWGGGLPMNAFPPPHYVHHGVYAYLRDPIYIGFVLAVGGAAVVAGSPSGLWLVTPAAAAGAAALVIGYERPDLYRRFGRLHAPLLALPPAAGGPPTRRERWSIFPLVFLPWLVAYEAVQLMGVPRDAVDSHLWFERTWPVWQGTTLAYSSVYLLVLATPFVIRDRRALRRFALTGLLATGVVTVIYLTVPLIAPPRPFLPTSPAGRMLAYEQAFNNTVAAFPAFHVLWPLIAAMAWPAALRAIALVWAVVIAASCITTGMHSLADVAAAFLLFPLLHRADRMWSMLRAGAERVANSWREWRIGQVRIINHGAYAGLATATGTAIAGWLAGSENLIGVLIVALFALIGAGLSAQWLEGSPQLLRPFGFYGGIAGGMLGGGTAAVLGFPAWTILGAYAVALPWVQAIGRLRCLVQGCCHGGPAPEGIGIRYRHPRSRVSSLAHLAGQPIHPTQLYSILGNVVIGVLVARLWSLAVPVTFVFGICLVLNGLARFVEESFRAEPQTPILAGLHVYHWLAVASVVVGIATSGIDAPPAPSPTPPGVELAAAALTMGVLAAAAMGIDFPGSNRRFSRLAAST